MGESACECVIAFCEVVIQAVSLDYQENEESSKECLLEMVELALHYLVLLEQYRGAECTLLITIIQQLLVSINLEEESRNNKDNQRGRPKVDTH